MLAKLLGANYRTTLSNLVALLFATATGIAAAPGELDILPLALYPYRVRIIAICGVIAFVSRMLNGQFQKDKTVTGGSTQQTVGGEVADAGTQTLVDQTVKASIASGDTSVTDEQKAAVKS